MRDVIWQKSSTRWLVALSFGRIRSSSSNFPEARYSSALKPKKAKQEDGITAVSWKDPGQLQWMNEWISTPERWGHVMEQANTSTQDPQRVYYRCYVWRLVLEREGNSCVSLILSLSVPLSQFSLPLSLSYPHTVVNPLCFLKLLLGKHIKLLI